MLDTNRFCILVEDSVIYAYSLYNGYINIVFCFLNLFEISRLRQTGRRWAGDQKRKWNNSNLKTMQFSRKFKRKNRSVDINGKFTGKPHDAIFDWQNHAKSMVSCRFSLQSVENCHFWLVGPSTDFSSQRPKTVARKTPCTVRSTHLGMAHCFVAVGNVLNIFMPSIMIKRIYHQLW